MARLDVMLSSTSKDVGEHRKLAEDACQRANCPPLTMDHLSAEVDTDAISVSMRLVEQAEIYVGIFGMRYGFRPQDERNPNDISITEMEYRRAKELGMPILIYIMSDDHPEPDTTGMGLKDRQRVRAEFFETDPIGIDKLEALKKDLMANEIVGFYTSPEDLRLQVLQSLMQLSTREAAEKYHQKQQERLAETADEDTGKAPQADIPYPPELYAFPPYSGSGAMFVGRREELQTLNTWGRS